MAKAEITECVQSLFEAACIELFQALDCVITKTDESIEDGLEDAALSYIDAGSDDLDVIIMMRIPPSVLSLTYPEFTSDHILSVDETRLEDWISELANQLVGRLKNKLIMYDCRLKIGLPTTFFDIHEIDIPVVNHERLTLNFDVDREALELSLFIEVFNEDMILTPPQEEDTGTGEGELELF